jgi:signal transduction histidine kinase
MTAFVFYIMLFAGLLTGGCFAFLYSVGVFPFPLFTPIFSPFIALIASSIVGTSLTAFACEKVLNPLNQLIKATKAVSTGDFSVRVKEAGNNSEIGVLLRNFNHMAEELGSIEMFRNDFINNFSHEFKTPLASIRGFAKQLQNENLPAEKRREYTDIIVSEAERLSNMSANILLLTKLENQQFVTDYKEYELDEQIRDCIILLEKQWSQKSLEMNLELSPVKIFGNEEMLSHLWINLIDNAIKYTNENGHITIMCCKMNDEIIFKISDDGNGMDDYTRKHIFDKFFQGDRSHTAQGNGLGMSIVKRILELCGGEITVESKINRGTTFTVKLSRTR